MKPENKLGLNFLIFLSILPIILSGIGALIGSQYGDWKQGGFWGIMIGLIISYFGHRMFNKQY